MVGPNYRRPDICMPEKWNEMRGEGITDGPVDLAQWWRQFGDPKLDKLIECALCNSPDLAIARARIKEARALRIIAGAPLYPQIDGSLRINRRRESKNTIVGGFPSALGRLLFDTYEVGFDASWEVDLFGHNRREAQAAGAELCATIAEEGDVMITLLAEVARNYVDVRCFQKRIAVAQANLDSQGQTVEITKIRFEAGLTDQLALRQAESLHATTMAAIPLLAKSLYAAMHRLGVLLGFDPDYLYCELEEPAPIPKPPAEIAAGLPCQILRRRPDVRAVEWELVAQNARIGVAIADLYPRLDLLAALGLASDRPRNLVTSDSRRWFFGGDLLQSIFHGGALRARVRAERATFCALLATYERTVLEALEEVRNAMVTYGFMKERNAALWQGVESSQQQLALSRDLYEHGLIDFLNVTDAEREVLRIQDDYIESECEIVLTAIALYKALGGGWPPAHPTKNS